MKKNEKKSIKTIKLALKIVRNIDNKLESSIHPINSLEDAEKLKFIFKINESFDVASVEIIEVS